MSTKTTKSTKKATTQAPAPAQAQATAPAPASVPATTVKSTETLVSNDTAAQATTAQATTAQAAPAPAQTAPAPAQTTAQTTAPAQEPVQEQNAQETSHKTESVNSGSSSGDESGGLVVLAKDFKVSNLTFTDPKKNPKTSKWGSIILNGKKVLRNIETPWLVASFGLSKYDGKGDNKGSEKEEQKDTPKQSKDENSVKYSVPLSARTEFEEEQPIVEVFFNQLLELEDKLIEFAFKNSKTLFAKPHKSKDVTTELFGCVVKNNEKTAGDKAKAEYPLRIQPQVSRNIETGKPNIMVYMASEKTRDMVDKPRQFDVKEMKIETFDELTNMLPPGSMVKAIIQPRLYFIAGRFGMTLNITQLLIIRKTNQRLVGYAFSVNRTTETETETEKETENADETENANEEIPAPTPTHQPDSDVEN